MSENEMLIHVDQANVVLGEIQRSQVHVKDNLQLHREAMGFLWSDETKTKFWLQRRSMTKEQYRGLWTLAVTCHVLWGDVDMNDPLGYVNAIEREAPEEIRVGTKGLELYAVRELKTEKNWAMSGVVVGVVDGIPRPDKDEVDEVRLFDKTTIGEIEGQLTPNARACLIILGILAESPEKK